MRGLASDTMCRVEFIFFFVLKASTWEVKSRVVMARAVFSKEKALYTSKLDLN